MAKNIIFYGAPGSGKTYKLEQLEGEYVDYDLKDDRIKSIFQQNSKDWLLISLILFSASKSLTALEIQNKITSLALNVTFSVSAVLEQHSVASGLEGITHKTPFIFFKSDVTHWYVDRSRFLNAVPTFETDIIHEWEKKSRFRFVTFHQSFSYEDFVEGIRPTYIQESKTLDYSPKDGVFKELCLEAEEHPEKQFAIFIDEINRGNISEIFGELITLIELDKRKGAPGEISTYLPYSHKQFTVPNNLDIYGSMNSSDKSIAQIDIALRRRFKFEKIQPSSRVIREEFKLRGLDAENIDGVNLVKLFDVINKRVSYLLDSDHQIGHSYFLKMDNLTHISEVIRAEIIPLLEEYFYNDLEKIQLVLNDVSESGQDRANAIYRSEILSPDTLFTSTDDSSLEEEKKVFSIADEIKLDSITKIYG